MKKTRKQHTVPQCYLTRFADSAGRLFAYDKENDRSYRTRVTDAAQEAFFYDFPPEAFPGHVIDVQAVEKALSAFETIYSPLLKDLIASAEAGSFSRTQIAEFAPFVVLQWSRTRTYRETAYEVLQKVGQDFVDGLLEANLPDQKGKVQFSAGREHLAILHANQMFDEERVRRVSAALEAHLWVIGINRTSHPFYTSDHPVVRRANLPGIGNVGVDKPGVEFVFPLSSNHVLMIMERSYFALWRRFHCRSIDASEERVADYNGLQVMRSAQRIFCVADDFALAKKVCNENPIVRNADRARVKVTSTSIKNLKSYMQTEAME